MKIHPWIFWTEIYKHRDDKDIKLSNSADWFDKSKSRGTYKGEEIFVDKYVKKESIYGN